MPTPPFTKAQNRKNLTLHSAIKWLLTLASGAIAFGLVIVLNGQL